MTVSTAERRAVDLSANRRWKALIPGAGLLVAGLVIGVVATRLLSSAGKAEAAPSTPSAAEASEITFSSDKWAGAGIELATINPESFNHRTWRPGRVAFNEERLAHIFPPADGIIREVRVKIGQSVNVGDILAVVDSRDFGHAKLEVVRTKTSLMAEREVAARTKITTTNAAELLRLLDAETPLADIEKKMADKPIGDWRQQLLTAYSKRNQLGSQLANMRNSGDSVSGSNLRKIEAETESATAGYAAIVEELRFQVKNQRRQSEVKLAEAETAFNVASAHVAMFGLAAVDLDKSDPVAEGASASYLPVKAPFAGVIVERHAVLSERVGPQTQMFVLTDLSNLWVQADLFEADMPLVRGLADHPIVFRSPHCGVSERQATVTHTGDLIDKTSRSMTLTAVTANTDRLLKPGMFVEVGFEMGDQTPVFQVPGTAVLRHENKPFVFVQTGDDTFRKTEVVIGRSAGDKVEVTEGLKPGDRVVVRGGFSLKSEMLKDQLVGE
ncbi:efflux RND transporter periplasmic adaptor subunit [Zavarzinella formosa]|uniref:efflux RND transporter periplasmic adaptor subunit n=1 Tax=Zavarzinella formosa TaxID=360055 RepID=UPI0002FA21EE|nr:efflux RND transporter periplasmic adaptor subunit [Zavarzinella formosa]